ncbi:1-aminocyclopropane-1-carboxylate deaminase/D-cysteine desulfhydrase [Paraglaciecola mesophila]|nr:pyridoxal-phosphate dependent enzyme [Paraglaciecola mesophila]
MPYTLDPLQISLPSPEQRMTPDWKNAEHLQIWVKRDDLIHEVISGNKWRKLRQSIRYALANDIQHIVSFGGGHSNHLHALGYVCSALKLKLTAIVRGHYHNDFTPMLRDLKAWQADIHFVDRKTYQLRDDDAYLTALSQQYPNAMFIPEGGSSEHALTGVSEILRELKQPYDYILAPVGSGGTLAGLITGASAQVSDKQPSIIGIGVLKGQDYLEALVSNLLLKQALAPAQQANWHIEHGFHFNGYAKSTPELNAFCQHVNHTLGIPIEPVYSGKLFWAAKALIEQNTFAAGSRILLLHTGGLQGARD